MRDSERRQAMLEQVQRELADHDGIQPDDPAYVRPLRRAASSANGEPQMVYSLRLPAAAVGRLREVADAGGVAPTVLLRTWILQRLEQEQVSASSAVQPIYISTPAGKQLPLYRAAPLAGAR